MQNDILKLARSEIVAMQAYRSARSEKVTGSIWLDANENPWGDKQYNRYPDQQPGILLQKLADLYEVNIDELLITRGCDEGIDLVIRLFCYAGKDKIIICPPTYGMYKTAAIIQGAGIVEVPLNKAEGFSLNIQKIIENCQVETKIIFLCSPNNPSGNLLNSSDIFELCERLKHRTIIVVDEAYIEFSGCESLANYIETYPNLIVLRTLSKAYGLAGIRCGVTIANKNIIQLLKKILAPYPVSRAIVNSILKKLDANITADEIKIIISEREKLFSKLSLLPCVKNIWKSYANFILLEVNDVKKMMNTCLVSGIVIRDRSNEHELTNCIRVTVGTPAENNYLMGVLTNG